VLRQANARVVLQHMWAGGPVTGSDLIGATGLSRATVHDVCGELIGRGWVREEANQREHGGYSKGRPARRYSLDPSAGTVLGVDAGQHHVSAVVADLLGDELARCVVATPGEEATAQERLEVVDATVRQVLALVPGRTGPVLAAVVGVPAPVGPSRRTSFQGNAWWERMNPDIAGHLHQDHGWPVLVENDANLAALAERWRGAARGAASSVTLLAGERFGAGVLEGDRLLRGAHGGAGEMRYLDMVSGVGSPAGVAALTRDLARAALLDPVAGPASALARLDPGALEAEAVFAAARSGDALAEDVLERVGVRLARVVTTLASLLDPERVIIAGAVAASCGPMIRTVERELARWLEPPRPVVLASVLGGEVVSIGAVGRALDHVREHALEIELSRPTAATGAPGSAPSRSTGRPPGRPG
jgi:predicted NBD/HSP70 family sugar kinase